MEKMFRRFIAALIKTGSLEIETASGARYHFGDGSGQNARLRFADKAAQNRGPCSIRPFGSANSTWMAGVIVDDGTIYDALAVICQNIDQLERIWWLQALTTLRGPLAAHFQGQQLGARRAATWRITTTSTADSTNSSSTTTCNIPAPISRTAPRPWTTRNWRKSAISPRN